MANSYSDVREMLRGFVGEAATTLVGEVSSVDAGRRTCEVDVDGVAIPEVMLQCVTEAEGGMVVYPAVGAKVLLLHITDSDAWMVVSSDEIERVELPAKSNITLTVGNSIVEIAEDVVTINGGNNGGAVNVAVLQEILGNIASDMTTLATLLRKPVVNGSPVGVFTPATQAPDSSLEDMAFKH